VFPPSVCLSRRPDLAAAEATMRHAPCIRAHHVRIVGAVTALATSKGVRRANAARLVESDAVGVGRRSHSRLATGSGRAWRGSAAGGGALLRAGRGASTRRAGVAAAAADADAASLGPLEEQAFDFDRCVLQPSSCPGKAERVHASTQHQRGWCGLWRDAGYRSARRRWWRPPCSQHAPVWHTIWELLCDWR
jgi:hypothetical protein